LPSVPLIPAAMPGRENWVYGRAGRAGAAIA
jgi:hypothetical protein